MAGSVTNLLRRWEGGDSEAESELFARVYKELRRLAGYHMKKEAANVTLQPTALVNEVFLRLSKGAAIDWHDRQHFLAIASRAMRRMLVDRARRSDADIHGGRLRQVTLDGNVPDGQTSRTGLLAVHAALERLEKLEPRQGKIVEMRYFAGFSFEEAAEVLGISVRTAKRDWQLARLWLYRELEGAAQ